MARLNDLDYPDAEPGDLVVQAECGVSWLMDMEPQPDWCSCEYWRLGVVGEGWGIWVDSDGQPRICEDCSGDLVDPEWADECYCRDCYTKRFR